MNREIDLSFACYGYVKELVYDLAILPWGLLNLIICIFPI